MKEFAKKYFKQLIKASPENLKLGDELKIAVRYRKEDGTWADFKTVAKVNKKEL